MRWLRNLILSLVPLLCTLLLAWYFAVGAKRIAPYPEEAPADSTIGEAPWFPKEKYGVNHIFLTGNAFERGVKFGRATRALLERQEDALVAKFNEVFPGAALRRVFILLAKSWFFDIDSQIREDWRREMHGVSLSAPAKYDYLADGYTRQLAYHGLHEAGQAFVDYGEEGFGCTVMAVRKPGVKRAEWLLGRNFDFEGGRIFDEEKILKWVFPEEGIPFVSVIWAGMVGAVTGVNQKGVYISLNAAGSKDFSRLGTPTTLVLLDALQHAATAEQAVEIIKEAQTVITEIFVVAGPGSPLYVVEKSPRRVSVARHVKEPVAVANHLLAPEWKNDSINAYRRDELTSAARLERASELVRGLAASRVLTLKHLVGALRDKQAGGRPQPGHRSAIDALIATHAVAYDTEKRQLFVSEGPSLSGRFFGFDLARSFALRRPVPAGELEADRASPPEAYPRIKADIAAYAALLNKKAKQDCSHATDTASSLTARTEHYLKHLALGLLWKTCGAPEKSRLELEKALLLAPAYARERRLAEQLLAK